MKQICKKISSLFIWKLFTFLLNGLYWRRNETALDLLSLNINNLSICYPNVTFDHSNLTDKAAIVATCKFCLPDCNKIKFIPKITNEVIRFCDEKNFGVSKLCDYKNKNLSQPFLFENELPYDPRNQNVLRKNTKFFSTKYFENNIGKNYHAYQKDIGFVTIFFENPVVLEYYNKPSQSAFIFWQMQQAF